MAGSCGGSKVKAASRMIIACVCLFFMFVALTGFSSPEGEKRKATWLWNTSLIASEPAQILSFLKEQGVSLLYLQIDTKQPLSTYQTFIREARLGGIDVHALGGSPSWGLADKRQNVLALVNWVHAYNQLAASDEKFTGIHLDIEPYLLPEWKADQPAVIRQWMQNVEAYTDLARQKPGLEIGCDIPFWLDKLALPDSPGTELGQWLIGKHDLVAIMSYRDRAEGPNSITSLAAEELGWGDGLGKTIYLGVETKQSSEGDFVSFYEEGLQQLNQEVAKLPALVGNHPSYGGVAVHSYEHWKALKE